jgi:hypothetical protein
MAKKVFLVKWLSILFPFLLILALKRIISSILQSYLILLSQILQEFIPLFFRYHSYCFHYNSKLFNNDLLNPILCPFYPSYLHFSRLVLLFWNFCTWDYLDPRSQSIYQSDLQINFQSLFPHLIIFYPCNGKGPS